MENEVKKAKKTPENIFREIFHMFFYMLFVVVVTMLIIRFVGQRTEVSGGSMENTLHDGDNLIVDKLTYRFRDPERFDIIVFPYKYKEKTFYIKRIIGLPGETVQITEEGEILIKGIDEEEFHVLEEDYGKDVIKNPGIASQPIFLSNHEYFVLGDNRNFSADSRDPSVGIISGDDIIGRAWIRIWPIDKFEILKHQ